MKKALIILSITTVLFSCKKQTQSAEERTETQHLRIEEVDKDGTTTVSQIITVKIDK